MRLPNAAHERHDWVIARIAPDFRLLDVWALPVEGAREDFDRALEVMLASFDPADAGVVTRTLFAVRERLGQWLRWDDPGKARTIPGAPERSLRERLPASLRGSAEGLTLRGGGFVPLYRTDGEWAAELSNDTVHGVLHLAWAPRGGDRFGAQLAVYVKTRGRLGDAYLAAIAPFRHLVVYPALIRQVGRAWRDYERLAGG